MSVKTSLNQALFDELMSVEIPQIKTAGGKYSLGIVNSKQNGKRLSFSQELAKKLDLTNKVYLMPAEEARKLVIGRKLPFKHAVHYNLSGEGKKIAYAAHFVEMLTKMFDLDFSKHVSKTFYNFDFDVINGNTVAIVEFPAFEANEAEATEAEATEVEATEAEATEAEATEAEANEAEATEVEATAQEVDILA